MEKHTQHTQRGFHCAKWTTTIGQTLPLIEGGFITAHTQQLKNEISVIKQYYCGTFCCNHHDSVWLALYENNQQARKTSQRSSMNKHILKSTLLRQNFDTASMSLIFQWPDSCLTNKHATWNKNKNNPCLPAHPGVLPHNNTCHLNCPMNINNNSNNWAVILAGTGSNTLHRWVSITTATKQEHLMHEGSIKQVKWLMTWSLKTTKHALLYCKCLLEFSLAAVVQYWNGPNQSVHLRGSVCITYYENGRIHIAYDKVTDVDTPLCQTG